MTQMRNLPLNHFKPSGSDSTNHFMEEYAITGMTKQQLDDERKKATTTLKQILPPLKLCRRPDTPSGNLQLTKKSVFKSLLQPVKDESDAEKLIFEILYKTTPQTHTLGAQDPALLNKQAESNLQKEAHRSFITNTLKKRSFMIGNGDIVPVEES
jgi:hypothetical protein